MIGRSGEARGGSIGRPGERYFRKTRYTSFAPIPRLGVAHSSSHCVEFDFRRIPRGKVETEGSGPIPSRKKSTKGSAAIKDPNEAFALLRIHWVQFLSWVQNSSVVEK